jgi:hypothetical protein
MISRTSDNQSWPDGVAIELDNMTPEFIAAEIKAREDARAILNTLAETGEFFVDKAEFDAGVLPMFRAAMHCDNEVEALSAAGVWFAEY